MNARKSLGLAVFKAVGLILGALLCPPLAFGVWLVLTPDYDGGRRGLGGLIIAGSVLLAVIFLSVYLLVRLRLTSR